MPFLRGGPLFAGGGGRPKRPGDHGIVAARLSLQYWGVGGAT